MRDNAVTTRQMSEAKQTALQVPGTSAQLVPQPGLDLQHTWFEVVREREWRTLALVPVDEDTATLEIAQGMGHMAAQEPGGRALVVNAAIAQCEAGNEGAKMEDLWEQLADDNTPLPYDIIDLSRLAPSQAQRALAFAPKMIEYLANEGRRYHSALFTTDSPLYETGVIPLLRAVDKVALCLRLGQSTLDETRRVVEIVGRERIVGTILIE